jgi:hypothetical protein
MEDVKDLLSSRMVQSVDFVWRRSCGSQIADLLVQHQGLRFSHVV